MAYRSAGEKRMYMTKLCSHYFSSSITHTERHTRTHLHTYSYTYTTHTQGDLPVGTLVSDPFKIDGTKISFLVGGGCNILEECVNQCTT